MSSSILRWVINFICAIFRILLIQILLFIAPYFTECISEQDLNEMNIEIIRNTLYRVYFVDSVFMNCFLCSYVVFCSQIHSISKCDSGIFGRLCQVLREARWPDGGSHGRDPRGECFEWRSILFPNSLVCAPIAQSHSHACTLRAQFEADRRAIMITLNSFGTELTKDDRARLYPRSGKLFPEGLAGLARADDSEQVRQVADYYSVCVCLPHP